MKNKYNNKQTVIQGHVFDSKKEAERYLELRQMQKEGKIFNLRLQPVYELQEGFKDTSGKKHQPITYIPDFDYEEGYWGNFVVEDVKGMKTEVYKLKKKLFLYKYRTVTFREV